MYQRRISVVSFYRIEEAYHSLTTVARGGVRSLGTVHPDRVGLFGRLALLSLLKTDWMAYIIDSHRPCGTRVNRAVGGDEHAKQALKRAQLKERKIYKGDAKPPSFRLQGASNDDW
jgi:hypothetical protein